MAKLRGPVASYFSGHVGEVVGAPMKGGETVIRTYRRNIKNPNTLRQQVSRNKMALASQYAAALSVAIKIGYAMATASTKMFARNMFVQNIVPVSKGVLTNSGAEITADLTKLPVSQAIGIAETPVIAVSAGTEAGSKKIDASNAADVVMEQGETLGLVVVALNEAGSQSMVRQGVATEGVTLSAADIENIGNGHFYAFFKAIPKAVNGVASTDLPWMYPSNTSGTTVFQLA